MEINKKNAGLDTSMNLSAEFGVPYIVPSSQERGVTDFNDIHKTNGIDEIKKSFENLQIHSDWDEPVLLEHKTKYGPHLDCELLPQVIKDFVLQSADRLQVAPEMIALPLLSVFASLVGRSAAIKPKENDTWLVIPKLWCLIVADPGQKKSPAFDCAMKSLDQIEYELDCANSANMQQWDIYKKSQDEKIKALRKKASKDIAKSGYEANSPEGIRLLDEAGKLEKELIQKRPKQNRLRTSDATGEKTLSMLKDNPNGLTIFRDEIAGLFSDLEKPYRASERALILESFNGDSVFKQDRMGRESVTVDGVRLTLIGGTQREMLQSLFKKMSLASDGLLQRFQLLAVPAPIEPIRKDVFVDPELSKVIYEKAKQIFEATQVVQAIGNLKEFRTIVSFDSEAQELFLNWLIDLDTELLFGNLDDIIKTHLSKYRSLIPELCLIFHIMDSTIDNSFKFQNISKATLERAITFSNFLREHMKIAYDLKTNKDDLALSLLAKIKTGDLFDGMTVRELQRKGWSGLTDNNSLWFSLQILAERNIIRTVRVPASAKGGASKQVIKINPKLLPTKLTLGLNNSTFSIQDFINETTSK